MSEANWVDEVLNNASKTVKDWPSWMRRPEVRSTESLMVTSVQQDSALDAAGHENTVKQPPTDTENR